MNKIKRLRQLRKLYSVAYLVLVAFVVGLFIFLPAKDGPSLAVLAKQQVTLLINRSVGQQSQYKLLPPPAKPIPLPAPAPVAVAKPKPASVVTPKPKPVLVAAVAKAKKNNLVEDGLVVRVLVQKPHQQAVIYQGPLAELARHFRMKAGDGFCGNFDIAGLGWILARDKGVTTIDGAIKLFPRMDFRFQNTKYSSREVVYSRLVEVIGEPEMIPCAPFFI